MTITIVPFTINQGHNANALSAEFTHVEQAGRTNPPITYWGIYLDDKHVSYTSSRELAEKTKLWMEKWLTRSI
jgi:hypothetical protein